MNFKIFAELIELKAKTASIFPFLLGLAYSLYHYQSICQHLPFILWQCLCSTVLLIFGTTIMIIIKQ